MNKCILFSLALARARAINEKMNLKQMVKSSKKSRRRGLTEREPQRQREET